MSATARRLAVAAALALAACATPPAERPPIAIAPPAARPAAPVAREPIPTPAVPVVPQPPAAAQPSQQLAFVASEVPPGTLYVCVSSVGGRRQQVAVTFDRNVETLCRKHPEMGPCQYERNVCRASGGRVFTATGAEITTATEAEYDKKVTRVRFRAD
jgi:hypothetical protein